MFKTLVVPAKWLHDIALLCEEGRSQEAGLIAIKAMNECEEADHAGETVDPESGRTGRRNGDRNGGNNVDGSDGEHRDDPGIGRA